MTTQLTVECKPRIIACVIDIHPTQHQCSTGRHRWGQRYKNRPNRNSIVGLHQGRCSQRHKDTHTKHNERTALPSIAPNVPDVPMRDATQSSAGTTRHARDTAESATGLSALTTYEKANLPRVTSASLQFSQV